jgi:hypothetical protein
MFRFIPALALILVVTLCLPRTNAKAEAIPSVAEMRAKVEAFVKRAYPGFDPTKAHVEYADINSDGLPEAFVIVRDRTACGDEGCALVLDIAADEAHKIAAFAGGELRALQTKNGAWRDIAIDGHRLRWRNGTYE